MPSDSPAPTDGKPVTVLDSLAPGDLDNYSQISAAQDRSHKVRAVIRTWQEQQDQERPLRKKFAWGLFWLLSGEVVSLFAFAFLLGLGLLHVEPWVATSFLIGVLTQTGALVLIVTKYLFPEKSQQILEIIEKL